MCVGTNLAVEISNLPPIARADFFPLYTTLLLMWFWLVYTPSIVCCFLQYEEGKLDDLLKEVAGAEVPTDAPTAPPVQEEEMELTDANMLPSQRSKSKNKCILRSAWTASFLIWLMLRKT